MEVIFRSLGAGATKIMMTWKIKGVQKVVFQLEVMVDLLALIQQLIIIVDGVCLRKSAQLVLTYFLVEHVQSFHYFVDGVVLAPHTHSTLIRHLQIHRRRVGLLLLNPLLSCLFLHSISLATRHPRTPIPLTLLARNPHLPAPRRCTTAICLSHFVNHIYSCYL